MNNLCAQIKSSIVQQENLPTCIALHMPLPNRVVRKVVRSDEMVDDIVQQTDPAAPNAEANLRKEASVLCPAKQGSNRYE